MKASVADPEQGSSAFLTPGSGSGIWGGTNPGLGSSAFLTPGSWIRCFFNPLDPGSVMEKSGSGITIPDAHQYGKHRLTLRNASESHTDTFINRSCVADPGCLSRVLIFTHPGLVMSNQRFFKIVCFHFPTNVPKKIEYIRFLNKIHYRTKTFSFRSQNFWSKSNRVVQFPNIFLRLQKVLFCY